MGFLGTCVTRQLCQAGKLFRQPCTSNIRFNQGGHKFLGRTRYDLSSKRSYSSQPEPKPGQMSLKARVALVVGLVGAYGLLIYRADKKKTLQIEKDRTKGLKKSLLGGQWELVNTEGELVKSTDYHGQWVLMYFGFTHCPDVCPDELEKMVKVIDAIDDDKNVPNIVPIFITVDPSRDTRSIIKNYIGEFSPKLIGLTGNDEQLLKAAKAYRVYYSPGPKDEDNDYIVDHTIITYLVNPDGIFLDYYGQSKTDEQITTSITQHMIKYDEIKKQNM